MARQPTAKKSTARRKASTPKTTTRKAKTTAKKTTKKSATAAPVKKKATASRKAAVKTVKAKKTNTKKTANKATKRTAKKASPKKMTAVKKAFTKSETMTHIATMTDLNRKQVAAVFDTLSVIMASHLSKKAVGEFTLPGLLKCRVIKKPATKARKGINPFTGEETMFKAKPARHIVKIRPLKKLKDMAE